MENRRISSLSMGVKLRPLYYDDESLRINQPRKLYRENSLLPFLSTSACEIQRCLSVSLSLPSSLSLSHTGALVQSYWSNGRSQLRKVVCRRARDGLYTRLDVETAGTGASYIGKSSCAGDRGIPSGTSHRRRVGFSSADCVVLLVAIYRGLRYP